MAARFSGRLRVVIILTIFPHRNPAMTHYILFVVYLLFFCWLIGKIPFLKNSGISPKLLLGLFILKAAAGVVIGWSALHLYSIDNDYWDTNKFGWQEYQLLIADPKEYFTNLFKSPYPNGYTNMFDSVQSFWNDLRSNLIVKLVSVIDIFSRGNYYVNSIFFSFIGFFGHVALYRIFICLFKDKEKLVIIGCFLLPSMLFYSSGIHKDCIIFFAVGMVSFLVFDSLQQNKFTKKRIVYISLALLLIFLIRNFILLALLPALLAWIIAARRKWSPFRTFIVIYTLCTIIFFNFSLIFPSADLPATIANRQWEFLHQPVGGVGKTDVNLTTLYPNFRSFANNAPQALNHILMRPYITELSSKYLLPMAAELLAYQLLFILFLLFRKRNGQSTNDPFIFFAVFFTLTVFLNIGYTIPNLGSLVRYRSLYLPLIITPLLCLTNWEKIFHIFKIKK